MFLLSEGREDEAFRLISDIDYIINVLEAGLPLMRLRVGGFILARMIKGDVT